MHKKGGSREPWEPPLATGLGTSKGQLIVFPRVVRAATCHVTARDYKMLRRVPLPHYTIYHLMDNTDRFAMTSQSIAAQIQDLDIKFRTACRQVTILNERVIEAQNRIDRLNAVDRHSFRYCLRLRLIVLEGVRNVYYEYATRCAASLDDLYLDLMESSYYRTADSDDDAYDTDVSMTY